MQHHNIVFTDLDGTLLDHHDYNYEAAKPLLLELEAQGTPVIPVTSKTRAELMALRAALNNRHPFVIENGAAIFIPKDYFPQLPDNCTHFDNFDCFSFSQPRAYWQTIIAEVGADFSGEFTTFAASGVSGIVKMTGLPEQQAMLANDRDFSEPVKWLGTEARRLAFVERLKDQGASVLQGGRFMHVLGACDKGLALRWLANEFKEQFGGTYQTIALGDGHNDVAMLNAADCAVVVRSPVNDFPEVNNSNLYQTTGFGPEGWVEGIQHFQAA